MMLWLGESRMRVASIRREEMGTMVGVLLGRVHWYECCAAESCPIVWDSLILQCL